MLAVAKKIGRCRKAVPCGPHARYNPEMTKYLKKSTII